ncbi:MAG: enoyl-CoA hydratase/isomerase family protein [Chloroflexi bacterium]|nr:enoyl-CoA hydratase/isomerase family protein [Chloroflexota bacterium]
MKPLELGDGTVLYEPVEPFARITLNRPDVLNAVNNALLRGLGEALDRAEARDNVRAVVLTGAGRAFCAGGDLVEITQRAQAAREGQPLPESVDALTVFLKIWDLSKPVIAAVRGYAVGQGCELAGICDITIAAEDAKFGEIQVRHGFGPVVLIAPYLLGLKRTKELMLSGETFTAQEAQSMGLVNRVVPADKVLEEAEALAKKIAALPRAAVLQDKRLINRSFELRGLLAALNHAKDPAYADLSSSAPRDEEGQARLRVLREQGWTAFLHERDAAYRKEEKS